MKEKPVACTQEAKQCPDGSYVGRTGPTCEFAACPNEQKIYSVDELMESNIKEGTEVLVRGRYTGKFVDGGLDYEGPSSGNYLDGETKSIHLTSKGNVLEGVEYNHVITVKGKVSYCGGKKIAKYICGLTDVSVVDETAGWKTYRNEEYGFEVKYPGDIFTQLIQEGSPQKPINYIPSYIEIEEKLRGVKLVHIIPIPYCGPSGLPEHCKSKTEDIAISFFPIERNFQKIIDSIKVHFGDVLYETNIANKKGIYLTMGAEGEGVYYFLIPIDNNKTLLIYRSYIDERSIAFYQGVQGFIPFTGQEKIFNQILSTFKFIK